MILCTGGFQLIARPKFIWNESQKALAMLTTSGSEVSSYCARIFNTTQRQGHSNVSMRHVTSDMKSVP
jgi:hypothetical protein